MRRRTMRIGTALMAVLVTTGVVVLGGATPAFSQATTSTTLVSSGSPSIAGNSVTYTATVSPTPDGGTVAFSDNGTAISTCQTQAVNVTTGQSTCAVTYTAAGTHPITAVYNGDTNFDASPTSNTVTQVVNAAPPTTTSTTLVSSGSPSTAGNSVTYTATVSPTPDGGTVAFSDNGTAISTCQTQAVNVTTGQATCAVTYSSAGSHPITAVYGGDTNFAASPTSNTVTQTVQTVTTTGLVSSGNPSVAGGTIIYTATVAPAPDGGTVAFSDNGNPVNGCGVQPLLAGVATCSELYASAGAHAIVAVYAGNTNFVTSTSSTLHQVVDAAVVPPAATSTTLVSSANPSTAGQSVSFTATVHTTGSSTPTGSVLFFDGSTLLGNIALAGTGPGLSTSGLAPNQAQFSTSALTPVPHVITATYTGDAADLASTSSPINQVVNPRSVVLPATTTALAASANPSAIGQSVVLTATVSPTPPGASLTGTVQFFDGTIALGSTPLSGTRASVTVAAQAAGTYVLTATYGGDANHAPSTSAALNLVVVTTSPIATSPPQPICAGTLAAGTVVGMAATEDDRGYWIANSQGLVVPCGDAPNFGELASPPNRPIVGIVATSDGGGYYLVASDGGVFTFGDAVFRGSTGAMHLNKPIVGMAIDSAIGGYWLVASDGGVFSFDAPFYGSTGAMLLNQPIVGMAQSDGGSGYWLVASDGGIFSFNAPFYGSMGGTRLNKPIVGMTADAASGGYWLVASDGGIFSFDAPFLGSTGAIDLNRPVVGMESNPQGNGYRFVASDAGIFDFGASQFWGSAVAPLPPPNASSIAVSTCCPPPHAA